MHYDFPGNIRELEHMIEQAVALVQNGVVTRDDVLPERAPDERGDARSGRTLADVVDAAERQAIEGALRDCDGSREKAAEVLGISRDDALAQDDPPRHRLRRARLSCICATSAPESDLALDLVLQG